METNRKVVMRVMFIVFFLIFIIVLLGLLNWFNKKQEYQPFTLEQQGTTAKFCEHYYESCVCYGRLLVMESYPMQYQCNGMKLCKEIDETRCRD